MPRKADSNSHTLSEVLNQLTESTSGDKVTLDDMLQSLGRRAYGPLLLMTALLEIFPLVNAIPGMYIFVALIVILLAVQLLIGKSQPWLPRRLRQFSLSRDKLIRSIKRTRNWTKRIDRLFAPRLTFFLAPPFTQVIALICIVMSLLFFPLSIIPGSETLLALPIFFFGLAFTANDGLAALLGMLVALGLVLLPVYFWEEITGWFA